MPTMAAHQGLQCPSIGPSPTMMILLIFATLVSAIEAYEAKRWPEGKIPGGKG